ncbi:MAG: tartrate dehydrogenase [Thermoanaerobacteraceae bacterium]|nr:tartrate dehydrogenase [Thermoanaerobacteraceae bacterium]
MTEYRIALIPGDGIGPEIVNEVIKVLKAIEQSSNIQFHFQDFPWGATNYLRTGSVAPDNFLEVLEPYDAIFLGAVGHPDVQDFISIGKLIFGLRKGFDQYVSYRPIKLLKGASSPLKKDWDIDMLFVRENKEGEYGDIGGRAYLGCDKELALQVALFTRFETERVMRFAFEQARLRKKHVTSITKSNALKHSMIFWDEVFEEISREYPDVRTDRMLVDAAAMYMILEPERFDVVVTSNLFGDILTDLGAALQGGLGFAPGANLNPERKFPSMFEPIHGSAPSMAGKGVVNPIAAIWASALMLDHLGQKAWADRVIRAIEKVLVEGKVRTPDIGGKSTTSEMGSAIMEQLPKC